MSFTSWNELLKRPLRWYFRWLRFTYSFLPLQPLDIIRSNWSWKCCDTYTHQRWDISTTVPRPEAFSQIKKTWWKWRDKHKYIQVLGWEEFWLLAAKCSYEAVKTWNSLWVLQRFSNDELKSETSPSPAAYFPPVTLQSGGASEVTTETVSCFLKASFCSF